VKVNVFAGAYHQLEKVWENEQGLLTKDIWNNHNKIEHYLDALTRFLCFEGYHDKIQKLKDIRTIFFKQEDPWYFANYNDFYDDLLKFGTIIKTNGISNNDEKFLDLSVSLPDSFAARYRIHSGPQKVRPFIHNDYCRAYEIADKPIRDHKYSVTKLANEYPKLNYFRKNNTGDGTSFYYYLRYAIPDIDKVCAFSQRFFDPGAFGTFILGSKEIASEFIDSALKFLDSGDSGVLDTLKHWNLDVGMAIRLRNIGTTSAKGKKPARAVCIDLVNVTEEIPACKKWTPPKLAVANWKKDGQKEIEWDAPEEEQVAVKVNTVKGKSGEKIKTVAYPVSGIDIRFSSFTLYNDSDELGGYIFGDAPGPLSDNQTVLPSKKAYSIKLCLEDFAENDDFAESKYISVGNCTLKEYRASFTTKVEFEDALFRTDSAVLLPEGYNDCEAADEEQNRITGLDVLRTIYIQVKEYPNQKLLITGHMDRVAKDSFNYPLSDDRAKSIMYLLEGKKEEWAKIADKKNHDKDIQTILKWGASEFGWDCDPGKVDGKI